MRNSSFDGDMAIQEVTRAYELATKLEPLLPQAALGEPQSDLAGVLFREVLQVLSMALSILNSGKSEPASCDPATTGGSSTLVSDQGSEVLDEAKTPTSRCRKRPPREGLRMNSWTEVTNAPHDDGYQWRKYGQKNIQKKKLLRSYYRCSYRDQGCQATKQIEQKGNSDQPLFRVTYKEEHTCQTNPNTARIALDPLVKKPCLLNFESNITNVSNQRSTLLSFHTSDKQGGELTAVNQQEEVICSSNCSTPSMETSMIMPVAVEGEDLEAVAHNEMDDMLASACLSPTWEGMGSLGFF